MSQPTGSRSNPRWVRLSSTNSLSATGVERAIAEGGSRVGSAVGSWTVFERSDDEIVFGDSLGFTEFRTAFRLPPGRPGTAEAATVVRYRWRRTGRFSFALVRPMHRRFIPSLLEETVGTGPPLRGQRRKRRDQPSVMQP